jgi:hypothetical protein
MNEAFFGRVLRLIRTAKTNTVQLSRSCFDRLRENG